MTPRAGVIAAVAAAAVLGWTVGHHDGAVLAGPNANLGWAETAEAKSGIPLGDRLRAQLARERAELRAARRDAARWRSAAKASPSVGEALTLASVVYGVRRAELSSVAWCESNHRPDVSNGPYRGLFQQGPMFEATPFGQAGLSVWSPYAAALSTAYTVRQQGWRQWECKP